MILIRAVITYITVVAVAFPLIFSRSTWSATLPGKSTMIWSSIVAAVMSISALRVWGIDLPEWVRFPIYLGIGFGVTVQLVTLLRVQYGRKQETRRERELRELRER